MESELSMSDREMFWREVLSTLKDRFVSSLTEIQSWEAENLLNGDKKLLSHLQLSVGLAYAISNATGSKYFSLPPSHVQNIHT